MKKIGSIFGFVGSLFAGFWSLVGQADSAAISAENGLQENAHDSSNSILASGKQVNLDSLVAFYSKYPDQVTEDELVEMRDAFGKIPSKAEMVILIEQLKDLQQTGRIHLVDPVGEASFDKVD